MKKTIKKKYIVISGFNLIDNNRGTAALGYGSIPFLRTFHKAETDGLNFCCLVIYKKMWKYLFKGCKNKKIIINQYEELIKEFYICYLDYLIYRHFPIISRFTRTANILKEVNFVAAINGGDGFSDIYGTSAFEGRLFATNLAMKEHIPLILLPQTIGPFKDEKNLNNAIEILKYAKKIYIRDSKFESELMRMRIPCELTNDLSYYMNPEKFNIDIQPNAVGLNVSGLCYSNKFRDLTDCFDNYSQLIIGIIKYFQNEKVPLYLISHSYNYKNPEKANDDMQASRDVYDKLSDQTNVYLIDRNLTSPQTKYLISKFNYFIGTRMHANFAAIFTQTPVFGLGYSYKYEGSFLYMGLKGQYASIINIHKDDIKKIILKIDEQYKHSIIKKHKV